MSRQGVTHLQPCMTPTCYQSIGLAGLGKPSGKVWKSEITFSHTLMEGRISKSKRVGAEEQVAKAGAKGLEHPRTFPAPCQVTFM